MSLRTPLLAILLLALVAVPAASAKAPRPKLARTVVVKPAGGTVKVKPRGKREFRLRKATAIPTGSRVDTSAEGARVKLTSARNKRGTPQSGVFSKGAFIVTQTRSGLTDLTLTGKGFGVCEAARAAGRRVTGARSRRRRLFGNAHGRFRSRGRNSSATVRGTKWSTEDTCQGTVTKNMSDSPTSTVVTRTGDQLKLELEPGYVATYYCNKFVIEPDTYCVALLAKPAEGLLGAGIITQVDRSEYVLCTRSPSLVEGCSKLPLSAPDEDGWRQSAVGCALTETGFWVAAWSFDYDDQKVNSFLYPNPLYLEITDPAPIAGCDADPPVPTT